MSAFNTVDWANGNSYLKIELNTGSGYIDMGTTQFMSVPYALFAGSSTNQLPNGTMPGQMLYWNGSQWATVAPGANGQNLTFCNGVPTWCHAPD
ncbi:hypothetical protein [Flavobacterium sp. 3HN19-14]|uniref:hypothetical protein n=1 Tax=Flavobacterium sp. 3HN19-14 TaxID=3448133 RepID=UPI003EDE95A8